MSKKVGFLYHPVNNHPEEIFEGFSWPCLFFGPLWYLAKGVYAWAAISFFAAWLTFGISVFVFPFLANNQRTESLLKKGYLREVKESNE